MKRKIALALSVGVILSLGGGGYAYAKTPVAYVSVDINPSVELGVNAFDKVVSVEAYNEDGQKILEGTDLVNSDAKDAVSTVISNAISDGYITQGDTTTSAAVAVEITTSTDKENVATELNESLKEVAEETLDNNNVDAEVETEKVALARRDEARKLGITPGKLNLIQKLQALDPTITVEDYKSSSVKDIQKKTKELRKNNKTDEVTTDSSINTDTNADVVAEENTQEGTLSKTSVDSEEATVIKAKGNSNSSNNKDNSKKEENSNINSNANSKKEEKSNGNEEKKAASTTTEKQNSSNNVNSQENNNSSNSEKNNASNSKSNSSNSNSSKSDNSDNGNSSSQNKGKSKNN